MMTSNPAPAPARPLNYRSVPAVPSNAPYSRRIRQQLTRVVRIVEPARLACS